MKKIKGFKKFGAVAAAVCATAGIVGGMSVPAMADQVTGGDSLSPETPILASGGFYKYLLMPESAKTPAAVMSFDIVAGSAAAASPATQDRWSYDNKQYDTKQKAIAAAVGDGKTEADVTFIPGSDGTPEIYAGVTATADKYAYNGQSYDTEALAQAAATAAGDNDPVIKHVTTAPYVYDAVFTDNQTTSTTPTTVITAADLADANGDGKADNKYAKSPVLVDFSGVTFTAPGVYRYEITENSTIDTKADIAPDGGKYYLDVYVKNDTTAAGGLKIDGYVFHSASEIKKTPGGRYADGNPITQGTWYEYTFKGDDARTEAYPTRAEAEAAAIADGGLASDVEAKTVDSKKDGLKNTMTAKELTVKKTISGNMADKTQEFGFEVVLDDDGDSSTNGVVNTYDWKVYDSLNKDYIYNGTIHDTLESAQGAGGTAVGTDILEVDHLVDGKGGTLAGGGNGTISTTLKGGEYIKVTGLPKATTYKVTETTDDDYILSSITGADESDTKTAIATGDMDIDTNITYNNAKDVTTPTGIVTQYLPFMIMAGAGVGVAVFFAVRKKRSEAED